MDFRKIIIRELKRQKKSRFWLGKQPKTPDPNTVFRYLRGEQDMRGENLAACLESLGLKVRP